MLFVGMQSVAGVSPFILDAQVSVVVPLRGVEAEPSGDTGRVHVALYGEHRVIQYLVSGHVFHPGAFIPLRGAEAQGSL